MSIMEETGSVIEACRQDRVWFWQEGNIKRDQMRGAALSERDQMRGAALSGARTGFCDFEMEPHEIFKAKVARGWVVKLVMDEANDEDEYGCGIEFDIIYRFIYATEGKPEGEFYDGRQIAEVVEATWLEM